MTGKTDHTGDSSAPSAIFIIYDIFGLSSQALQGADILAHATGKSESARKIQVFMPDLFHGKPAPLHIFPPDTPEKKKELGAFFGGPAKPSDTAEKVPQLLKALNEKVPGISKWGLIGFCWGAKVREGFLFWICSLQFILWDCGGVVLC